MLAIVGRMSLALLGGIFSVGAQQEVPDPIEWGGGQTAKRQSWIERKGRGNPFWLHPRGDGKRIVCPHRYRLHRSGHAIIVPCTHWNIRHPDGDARPNTPCAHKVRPHGGGDDTGKKVPCGHRDRFGRRKHRDGDAVKVPCTHWVTEHPQGHSVAKTPCVHRSKSHPSGHATGKKAPCGHWRKRHPKGHPGRWIPCVHQILRVKSDRKLALRFYTKDKKYQEVATKCVKGLTGHFVYHGLSIVSEKKEEGPELRRRFLHLFYRKALYGDSKNNKDPMWSHYNSQYHSVQITKGHGLWSVLPHEIGHAIVGNTCIKIDTKGGGHSLVDELHEGTAFSEGWAHFIALWCRSLYALDASGDYAGVDWEKGEKVKSLADKDIPYSPRNEFRVGAILWDLYDSKDDGNDGVSFTLLELFEVFNLHRKTVRKSLRIKNISDFLARLMLRHPDKKAAIRAIYDKNLTKPK